MSDASQLLEVLNLEMNEPGRFRAQNFAEGPGNVVFGGQLLAQTIVAASTVDPDKVLKSVHTIFARGADREQPLDIEVETMHVGRALGQRHGDDPAG